MIKISDECKIGPISITDPHLKEGNKYGTDEDNLEEFSVICTYPEAQALIGLSNGVTSKETGYGVSIIYNNNPWNPVYIDTSNGLTDNEYLQHKGWYVLNNVTIDDDEFLDKVQIRIMAYKVSQNEKEYLTMNYTTGVNDGTRRDNSYNETIATYELNDDFSTFDTVTNWNTASNDGLTSPSITSDGTDLILAGASTSNGTYKAIWTQTKNSYDAPFISEFDFKWVSYATSTSYPHVIRVMYTPNTISGQSSVKNGLYIDMWSFGNYIQYQAYNINSSGVSSKIIPLTTTTATTHNWRVTINSNKTATLYLDTGSGYLQKWSGTLTMSTVNDIKPSILFYNRSTTSESMKIGGFNIYDNVSMTYNNIVVLPESATDPPTATFTRVSEDGNLNCYANPSIPISFTVTKTTEYDGSVKAYSTNNPSSTSRQIYGNTETIIPTKFETKNGLIKLVSTSTGFSYYYWNGSSYVLLNTFVIGTINLLKILYSSPERVTFQANKTKWTMYRGKPFITVEHSETDISYTIKSCYYHDASTTTDPAADADITMSTQMYANVWSKGTGSCASPDPADNTRLQIIKASPTTIKSDKIPMDNLTGIGHYDNTVVSGYNLYSNLPLEWMVETKTWIGIQQI